MPGLYPCRTAALLVVIFFVLTACFAAAQAPEEISPAARAYLEEALDLMQKNALNSSSIDWKQVRQDTQERARNAKTTFDTYPAIAYALAQLKEHHSFFQVPDSLPADKKEAAYAEISKILVRVKPAQPSPFAPSKEIQGHLDRRDGKAFAHVIVPMCIPKFSEWDKNEPEFRQFAEKLHGIVTDLQAQQPDGWIIDLRGNDGGDMWPMLAGIGAVLGEGDAGAFVSPNGERDPWFYKAGKAGTRSADGSESIAASVSEPPFSLPGLPWVAVLIDRGTASSGEAVAISFAGRAHERSFGEHTAGFSTSNDRLPLSDGAALFLCSSVEADRTGHRYPDGIDPDAKFPAPGVRPSEDKDAVIQAAEGWITDQAHAHP
jgi:carboxyl-terminal processing protease